MNEEAQRIAIGESYGWTWVGAATWPKRSAAPYWHRGECIYRPLPDYLSDLNAMHEAEKTLTAEQQLEYARRLHQLFAGQRHYLHIDFDCIHATAAQRAEAFLRTIGKWVEE